MRALWISLFLVAAVPAIARAQFDNLYTGGVVIDPSNSLGMLLATEQIRHSLAQSMSDKAPAGKQARRKPITASDFKGTGARISGRQRPRRRRKGEVTPPAPLRAPPRIR